MLVKSVMIISTILLFCFQLSGQLQDGSVLGRRITIQAENQTIANILDQISWQAKVYFSYDASLIEATEKHSIEAVNKSLYTILHQLFDSEDYQLNEIDNQIIIANKKPANETTFNPDSIPERYYFISGKVVDSKKSFPLPYATISLLNKPIGTITNDDGEFLLKLHPKHIIDTLVISNLGYARYFTTGNLLLDQDIISLEPVSIRLREVSVSVITPLRLLERIRENLHSNYSEHSWLMEAFYRETVKQDGAYINISEAVTEILKTPYNSTRPDLTKLIKGRQSPEVKTFKWLNLKLQGGPFTITKLDVVKTMESFLEEGNEARYSYKIPKMILYHEQPVYILEFEPIFSDDPEGFIGELFVHRETFAIVHARFGFNRNGLKQITPQLIRHTPPGVKARPTFVEYQVTYQQLNGKWHLATARASLEFKIRSRRNKINSEFKSVSEILITNIQSTELKRFNRGETFSSRDIFVELIGSYDPGFWQNYNIIKPDEDLRNAVSEISAGTP